MQTWGWESRARRARRARAQASCRPSGTPPALVKQAPAAGRQAARRRAPPRARRLSAPPPRLPPLTHTHSGPGGCDALARRAGGHAAERGARGAAHPATAVAPGPGGCWAGAGAGQQPAQAGARQGRAVGSPACNAVARWQPGRGGCLWQGRDGSPVSPPQHARRLQAEQLVQRKSRVMQQLAAEVRLGAASRHNSTGLPRGGLSRPGSSAGACAAAPGA